MSSIILKPSRESSLLRKHPWIFSGAIDKVEGNPSSGETVDIFSAKRQWLARGAFSPQSQIRVRVWTFEERKKIDDDFFRKKISRALALRNELLPDACACRLVYGESDGLPGVIVDQYGKFLVVQFLSAGSERWKAEIISLLNEIHPNEGIYERSDAGVREKEGLPLRKGLLSGNEPPEFIEVPERDCRFLVDVRNGHKTGFYLDQRESRALVARYAKGNKALNCFSYTGAFGVAALKAGAERIVNIDSSADALALAEKHIRLNNLNPSKVENIEGDVFSVLRKFRSEGKHFDMVILDPPKFVESTKHLEKAARGYKDINMLALQIIKSNGLLITFSCSGLLETSLFQKIVADAAIDANREAIILERMTQPADHPVALNFPEGSYLKGLVCKTY